MSSTPSLRWHGPLVQTAPQTFSISAGWNIRVFLQSKLWARDGRLRFIRTTCHEFWNGSIARGEEQTQSDIDLLLVGPSGMTELLPALRRIEQQFAREVNVTRYSESEFFAKQHGRDHFLNSILKGKLITIAGSLNELEKATGRNQSPRAQDK